VTLGVVIKYLCAALKCVVLDYYIYGAVHVDYTAVNFVGIAEHGRLPRVDGIRRNEVDVADPA
jgi:hypothetical protein